MLDITARGGGQGVPVPWLLLGWTRRHRAPGAVGGAPDGAGQSPVSPKHAGPLCPLRTPPRKGFHTHFFLERRWEGASPAAVPLKTRLAGDAEGRKITTTRGGKGNFQALGLGFFLFSPRQWLPLPRHRCEQPHRAVQTLHDTCWCFFTGKGCERTAPLPGAAGPRAARCARWEGVLEPRWGRSAHLWANLTQIGAQVPPVCKGLKAARGCTHPPSTQEEGDGELVAPLGAGGGWGSRERWYRGTHTRNPFCSWGFSLPTPGSGLCSFGVVCRVFGCTRPGDLSHRTRGTTRQDGGSHGNMWGDLLGRGCLAVGSVLQAGG